MAANAILTAANAASTQEEEGTSHRLQLIRRHHDRYAFRPHFCALLPSLIAPGSRVRRSTAKFSKTHSLGRCALHNGVTDGESLPSTSVCATQCSIALPRQIVDKFDRATSITNAPPSHSMRLDAVVRKIGSRISPFIVPSVTNHQARHLDLVAREQVDGRQTAR